MGEGDRGDGMGMSILVFAIEADRVVGHTIEIRLLGGRNGIVTKEGVVGEGCSGVPGEGIAGKCRPAQAVPIMNGSVFGMHAFFELLPLPRHLVLDCRIDVGIPPGGKFRQGVGWFFDTLGISKMTPVARTN